MPPGVVSHSVLEGRSANRAARGGGHGRARRVAAGGGPGLPEPHRAHRRRPGSRRRHGHPGAAARAENERRFFAAGDRGEQGRCRRPDRHPVGRPRRARRLYAAARTDRQHGVHAAAEPEAAVFDHRRFRADRDGRDLPADGCGQRQGADPKRGRTRRCDEGRPEARQLRRLGPGLRIRHRALQSADPGGRRIRPVQEHGRDDWRGAVGRPVDGAGGHRPRPARCSPTAGCAPSR